jgi:hypothetical protein
MTMELVLPDGRRLMADHPSPDVRAAIVRVAAALDAGCRPAHADARLVRLWLASQDERHGGQS